MSEVDAIFARLLALHPKKIDLSLDRVRRILGVLDHPERKLPPVIHVAGTNGKGSTIAFLRAMLEAAGRNVHVYTSPNLVRINERFRLGRDGGGRLVEDAELGGALTECEAKNGGAPITVFDVAGTNGKGSTIAFMRAVLEAAGASVHVYTSPNLVRLNERFRLGRAGGGVLVPDDELAATFGAPIRDFIEQRLMLVTSVFVVFLVGGFFVLRYV